MATEFWLDDNCLLVGDIKEADDSFDHEFGVEKQTKIELDDFRIIVFFDGGFEYDITETIKDKYAGDYLRLKEKFLEVKSSVVESA